MDIIVTVKQVSDPEIPPAFFKVDEAARQVLLPPGMSWVMNGYDANALEAGLRLKELHGGKLTVISLGDYKVRDTLKRALAMGADQAILLDDPAFADGDSYTTALALTEVIKKNGSFDLILSGRQASDTDAGQVHLGIAELLGIPGIVPVLKVEKTGDTLQVERLVEGGLQVLEVQPPAALGISSEFYEPRNPSVRNLVTAGRSQIQILGLADLGLTASQVGKSGARCQLRRLFIEARESCVELIESDPSAGAGIKLAERLHDEKLI